MHAIIGVLLRPNAITKQNCMKLVNYLINLLQFHTIFLGWGLIKHHAIITENFFISVFQYIVGVLF